MEPEGSYHIHNSLPLVLIFSQFNTLHILTPYFFKIHFNIILPTMLTSPRMPLQVFQLSFVFISCLPRVFICPTHLILLNLITLIESGEQHKL